uniref:Uncharacterized protein n=1 Tax=Paramormyrops kingsleyae TaxID=1676925 RepID=A0A3B3R5U6_9TELE
MCASGEVDYALILIQNGQKRSKKKSEVGKIKKLLGHSNAFLSVSYLCHVCGECHSEIPSPHPPHVAEISLCDQPPPPPLSINYWK